MVDVLLQCHRVERHDNALFGCEFGGRITAADTAIVLWFKHYCECRKISTRAFEAEVGVWAAKNLLRVVIVLAIVFPPAKITNLVTASRTERRIAAAGARKPNAIPGQGRWQGCPGIRVGIEKRRGG